jgi:hypothetical protein
MTQRKAYKYVLVPDGFGPKSGALFLALKRIPVSGSDFPESPRRGNRIRTQESEKRLRQMESGNGNSISCPKELTV